MKLTILSPEKQILSQEVAVVELPGAQGRFTVLQGHARLITSLVSGVVRFGVAAEGEDRQEIEIKGGFAEVKNDEITVCVD